MKPFDATGAFRPAVKLDELRGVAIRGTGATLLSSGVGLAAQVVSTTILARLLAPADFGVVAMVTTFSLLVSNFGLNGFTEAVVQRQEIDHALASNLFWINLGAGVLLTAGFVAAGSQLANFYHDARVARIAAGLSLTIIATSASVLHLALLKRAMRFSALSINNVIAHAGALLLAVVLAWAGWGCWALVAGFVAQPVCAGIGAFVLCRWIPGPPQRADGVFAMVKFALNVYGRFTVNYGSRNMDNALVGWRFNAQTLGFYKKAYDLFAVSGALLVSSLTTVAVPALSRLRSDPVQYKRRLLSALEMTAFVGMGVGANLMLVGKDAVRLLLGPGWEESGRIFTFFGPGIGMMLLYGTHGWIHLSIGTPGRWFRWGILEFAFTGLLFVAALPSGPVAIAAAWTASFWILTIPAIWYAGRPIQFGVGPVIAVAWKYVAASVAAACACGALLPGVPFYVPASGAAAAVTRIATASVLFGSLYLGAVALLHRGAEPLRRFARLLREMDPRRARVKAASAAIHA